jgi:hypothetical protein
VNTTCVFQAYPNVVEHCARKPVQQGDDQDDWSAPSEIDDSDKDETFAVSNSVERSSTEDDNDQHDTEPTSEQTLQLTTPPQPLRLAEFRKPNNAGLPRRRAANPRAKTQCPIA